MIEDRIRGHIEALATPVRLEDITDPTYTTVTIGRVPTVRPVLARRPLAVAAAIIALVSAVVFMTDRRPPALARPGPWTLVEEASPVFAADASASPAAVSVRALVPYGGGLLAFGVVGTYGGETAAVWRSSDGRAWRRVEADSFAAGPADRLLQPNSSISAVAVRGRRLVALGQATSANPADGRFLLSTWTSVDGDQWERHDLPTDAPTTSEPTPAPSPMPSGIVATPKGFVAFANDDTDVQSGLRNRTLVFTSPDGVTWSRTAVDGLGDIGNTVLGAVMYRGDLVAYGGRGGNNGTPAASVSNDNGTSWNIIPLSSQSTLPYGGVQQAVATASGLLLIGFSTPGLTSTRQSGPGAPLILDGEWDTVAWRSAEGDDFTPLDTSVLNTIGFDTVTAVAAAGGGAVLAMQRTEPAGHTTHVFGWSTKTGFVESEAGGVATVSALIDYHGAFLAMADASRYFDPSESVLNTVVWRAPHR